MTLIITDENFNENLMKFPLTIFYFSASWCGPCKTLTPLFEEVSKEFTETIVFGKVDIEENQEKVAELGIQSVPTLIFFKNGIEFDRVIGLVSKPALVEKISQIAEN